MLMRSPGIFSLRTFSYYSVNYIFYSKLDYLVVALRGSYQTWHWFYLCEAATDQLCWWEAKDSVCLVGKDQVSASWVPFDGLNVQAAWHLHVLGQGDHTWACRCPSVYSRLPCTYYELLTMRRKLKWFDWVEMYEQRMQLQSRHVPHPDRGGHLFALRRQVVRIKRPL